MQNKQNNLKTLIKGHLFLLVILLPLVFWLDTATIFALPKLLALRIVSLSAALFIIVDFFLAKNVEIRIPKYSVFLGIWILSLIISTIFSISPYTSLFGQYGRYMGLFTLLNLSIIPFYIANYFSKNEVRELIYVSICTSCLVALYGFLQYYGFFGLWAPPFEWTDSPQNRVFATMGHANHLGAYLAAHLLMLTYSVSLKKIKRNIPVLILQIIGMGLLAYVLILTASRGAVFALVLSAFTLFILGTWKNRSAIKKSLSKIVISASVIFILIVLSGGFIIENLSDIAIVKRTEQTINTVEKGVIPDRLSFIYSSWSMFLDYPLTGTGLSTFRDAYSKYRRADYQIDGPGNAQYITVPEAAHNEYLNTLATQGIIGLIGLLAVMFSAIILAIQKYLQAEQKEEKWHLIAMAGVLVFAFQVIFNFGEIVNWFVFFMFIGIILNDQKDEWKLSLQPKYPVKILILLMIFGIVGISFRVGVIDEWQADLYLRKAKEAAAAGEPEHAANYYQVSIAGRPEEYKLHQAYADFLLEYSAMVETSEEKHKLLKRAVDSYETALIKNPNFPSTYHNLALAYLQLYRMTSQKSYARKSLENYELSIEKSPNNPRYLYEYARKLHSDWDDKNKSVQLLREALKIAPAYQEPQDYLDFLYRNHPVLKDI